MENAVKERPSLSLTRNYDVPPEKVWQAWTDAQAVKSWFAPNEAFSVPEAELDVRVGGRYRIVMQKPVGAPTGDQCGGGRNEVSGVYKEVIPNRKLVFTWAWSGTPERESLVTLTLRAIGSGTELTLKHEQFADEETRGMHNEGWTGCLDHLGRFLA
ncbi:MAG: SRPBCC domain-containing protein [Burkholderiaceae bacterium]|nr:MAG: SRPBCC domain-containing protein [Burkholderiaceae bacterium]